MSTRKRVIPYYVVTISYRIWGWATRLQCDIRFSLFLCGSLHDVKRHFAGSSLSTSVMYRSEVPTYIIDETFFWQKSSHKMN